MKRFSHVGIVRNHNYGKPYTRNVELREAANFWVDTGGTKYRKVDGRPAGADIWNQSHLDLESIKVKPVTVAFRCVGSSHDGRTNKWQVDCPRCNRKVNPPTTLMRHDSFECACGTRFVADWNVPTVKVKE